MSVVLWVPFVLLAAWSSSAVGQPSDLDRTRARELFEQGVNALREENYPDALSAFQASWQLSPRANVMYNIANCQRALFDYPAAIASFEKYLEVGAGSEPEERRAEVRGQIADLEQRVGTVVLTVEPAGAAVRIDGRDEGTTPLAEPVRVGPGQHVVEVRQAGFEEFRRELTIEQGERVELVVALVASGAAVEPPPEQPDSPVAPIEPPPPEEEDDGIASQWWFWTILGVVIAGGAVTAGILLWPSDEGPADDWVLHGP